MNEIPHHSAAESTDPLDFSYLNELRCIEAGEGRVYLGRSVGKETQAPVLTFVHGGCMGAWGYAAYLRYFDQLGIPCAAVDCRGHGGLPQGDDFVRASVKDFASDVVAACNQISGPPILAGHSLGALIVGVAQHQVETAGLVLLAPSPPGQLPGARSLPLMSEEIPYHPTDSFHDKLRMPGETRDIAPFVQRLCRESPVALNERYSLSVQLPVPREGVPAICLSASDDDPQRHPPGQDRATADFFGAHHIHLPNAPHCFMMSVNWTESASILADWYRLTFRND